MVLLSQPSWVARVHSLLISAGTRDWQSPDICNWTDGGTLERQGVGALPFWVGRDKTPCCFQSSESRGAGRRSHTVMSSKASAGGDAGGTMQPEIGVPGGCGQGALVVCTVLESNSRGEEGRSLRDSTGWEDPCRLASRHFPGPEGRPASSLPRLHPSSLTVQEHLALEHPCKGGRGSQR